MKDMRIKKFSASDMNYTPPRWTVKCPLWIFTRANTIALRPVRVYLCKNLRFTNAVNSLFVQHLIAFASLPLSIYINIFIIFDPIKNSYRTAGGNHMVYKKYAIYKYTVKKVSDFTILSLYDTNQTLPGWE
jgi:hypothetical protein